MVDNLSRWAEFKLSGSASFGLIWLKLGRSVANAVVVAVAWSAAVGAPCGRSIVPFWGRVRTILLPVKLSWRVRLARCLVSVTPRLVVEAALIREVGFRSDGKENSSNNTDV